MDRRCQAAGCVRPPTRRARCRVTGILFESLLCEVHAGMWAHLILLEGSVLSAEFDPNLGWIDGPSHPEPADGPVHSTPTSLAPPDEPIRTWNLTCEHCKLPIIRRGDVWAAVFSPGQFHNEQDAQRFEALATNHEHRPG